MTDNPVSVELVIRGDLDQLRAVLDLLTPPASPTFAAPVVKPHHLGYCGEQHPHHGWTCKLPEGHDGRHDPEPHLPVPETAGEVEDAPVKQAPEHRGEAVERPTSPALDEDAGDATPVAAPASSPDTPAGPRHSSAAQRRMIFATFGSLGYTDEELGGREARLQVLSTFAGREVESSNDLTSVEAKRVIDTLAPCKTRQDVENIVGRMLERSSR